MKSVRTTLSHTYAKEFTQFLLANNIKHIIVGDYVKEFLHKYICYAYSEKSADNEHLTYLILKHGSLENAFRETSKGIL